MVFLQDCRDERSLKKVYFLKEKEIKLDKSIINDKMHTRVTRRIYRISCQA
jgi:hypothetical protein